MTILLYVDQQTHTFQTVFWIIGFLLASLLIFAIFWQYRKGHELEEELEQLGKQKKKDIELDFVLKAMGLSIWHINTESGQLFFDKDFREKRSETVTGKDGDSFGENATLLVEEDSERVTNHLAALCSGRTEEYHEQYRVRVPHSSKTYWEESYATIADRDIEGKPLLIVGTTQRIDERKNLENALKNALSKAEESDRLKSAFIANMSHEIRTPLNAIIGFTSVLPDIDGKEERQELINLIQENNQKLLRIIDDVMNISKIEAGKEQLQMLTFDINPILDEVVNKYMPDLKPGVTMTTRYATQQQEVTTDLTRLTESLNHLVSNAVKFTNQGSITVGYEPVKDRKLHIWVRDTGIGIAPENHERVFERFYKVDEFVPGAGLGLSLCRTMAFSLGGNVGVDSRLGEGSTFWMEIPV
jgi:signal transduction histidine kinase